MSLHFKSFLKHSQNQTALRDFVEFRATGHAIDLIAHMNEGIDQSIIDRLSSCDDSKQSIIVLMRSLSDSLKAKTLSSKLDSPYVRFNCYALLTLFSGYFENEFLVNHYSELTQNQWLDIQTTPNMNADEYRDIIARPLDLPTYYYGEYLYFEMFGSPFTAFCMNVSIKDCRKLRSNLIATFKQITANDDNCPEGHELKLYPAHLIF